MQILLVTYYATFRERQQISVDMQLWFWFQLTFSKKVLIIDCSAKAKEMSSADEQKAISGSSAGRKSIHLEESATSEKADIEMPAAHNKVKFF